MKQVPGLDKDVSDYLWLMAECAVTIPVGGKVGRWTRDDRVVVVWSAICSMCKLSTARRRAP